MLHIYIYDISRLRLNTAAENKIDSNEMFGEVVGRLLGFPEEIIFLSSS